MSETSPLVTIGIPTYNRADSYLPDAVRSALAQTYPNLEIVVSDNGSMDGTQEFVTSLGDRRVRYVRQEPAVSPNANFNACLDLAKGEYFLLLHDDDQVDPDFIEMCMHVADQTTGTGVIRTGNRIVDERGQVLAWEFNHASDSNLTELFLGWFRGDTSAYFCNQLFHTRALRDIGGFASPKNLVQDNIAMVKLAAHHGWANVPQPKASFRRHARKMAQVADVADWCEDSEYVLDLMCELAPERVDQVREEGLVFFTKQNYQRISRAQSFRPRHYWKVYRYFGFRYSPFTFLASSILKSWRRWLRMRINSRSQREVRDKSDRRTHEAS